MLYLVFLAALAACGGGESEDGDDGNDGGNGADGGNRADGGNGGTDIAESPFDPAVTTIAIEIDYMIEAEPYVGPAGRFDNVWQLFGDNMARMFSQGGKDVVYPSTLDRMEALSDVLPPEEGGFTVEGILALADTYRDLQPSATSMPYYVIFLDGLFTDDNGPNDAVLGVSLGDTRVIAIFKPVIESAGAGPFTGVAAFIEQTTLIHEVGHAIGMVNRGVELTSEHHDSANGAHCTNRECVMYYLNEGVSDIRDFVIEFVATGDTVVFGDECLADLDAAQAGAGGR